MMMWPWPQIRVTTHLHSVHTQHEPLILCRSYGQGIKVGKTDKWKTEWTYWLKNPSSSFIKLLYIIKLRKKYIVSTVADEVTSSNSFLDKYGLYNYLIHLNFLCSAIKSVNICQTDDFSAGWIYESREHYAIKCEPRLNAIPNWFSETKKSLSRLRVKSQLMRIITYYGQDHFQIANPNSKKITWMETNNNKKK